MRSKRIIRRTVRTAAAAGSMLLLFGWYYAAPVLSQDGNSGAPERSEVSAEPEPDVGRPDWHKRKEWRRMHKGRHTKDGSPHHHGRRGMLRAKARFLEFSHKYFESVQDPYQALGFAAVGIKEYYRREGKPQEAVKELTELLDQTKDRKARNILLFSIRQIYESTDDKAGFMKINRRIISENLNEIQ